MAAPASRTVLTIEALRRALSTHTPDQTEGSGRPAAVLIPLFERDGRLFVLLTERTIDLPSHAGQISFPGGKRDPGDANLRATALREAYEEIGLAPSAVEVLGELDDCETFVTNFLITPVVGIIPDRYRFRPNAGEIESLIEAPLDDFVAPGALRVGTGERVGLPFVHMYFEVGGHIVWGATARILMQLFSLLDIPMEVTE